METSRPTTHDNPACVEEGVVRCCASNMPGAGARTLPHILADAAFPYLYTTAARVVAGTALSSRADAAGVNTACGKITIQEMADIFGLPSHQIGDTLSHQQ